MAESQGKVTLQETNYKDVESQNPPSEQKQQNIAMADATAAAGEGRDSQLPEQVEVKSDVPVSAKLRGVIRNPKSAMVACFSALAFVAFLLGLVILILAYTVFRSRQPVITIDAVALDSLSVNNMSLTLPSTDLQFPDLPSTSTLSLLNMSDLSVNLTLGVNVSVYNPNHASFRYGDSMSYLYYREIQVGQAPVPAGMIGARGTERLSTKLMLSASSAGLLSEPHLLLDFAAGSFPMTTSAEVNGRVNFLHGLFKHHARASTRCSMDVSVSARAVQNMSCSYSVKL